MRASAPHGAADAGSSADDCGRAAKRARRDDGDSSAWQALRRDGVCALSNVVSAEWLASAQAFVQAMSPCVRYGGLRVELSIARTEEKFASKTLLAHSELAALLKRALGQDLKLLRVGGIMSFPGADDQPVHRDGQPLFTNAEMAEYEEHASSQRSFAASGERSPASDPAPASAPAPASRKEFGLPPHALHVWIPISANYSIESGATSFFLGSHLSDEASYELLSPQERNKYRKEQPIVPPGSVLVFDDRIFHYGGENRSQDIRTCIFYSFSRPYYTDGTLEADRDTTGWTEIE
eukprot:Tamp_21320.p1 GENE.Tamp_21320~~Tamp_21320.p1  ORF type:complete len:294 (+),score=41.91 Tamp_21320:86-967(+)